MILPGTPSDEVSDVLDNGNGDITTAFVSMATRHPEGTDAEYLQWHSLDHRPEQHRLSAVRASLRLVSTPPAGRPGRHFFTDVAGMDGFLKLSKALGGAGRKLPLLPHVEHGVYGVQTKIAATRVKIGADVLPWWPVRGVYLLLETGDGTATDPTDLIEVEGVAGIWSTSALVVDPILATARPGQKLTYCFLDHDPVDTAERLRPVLEKRWSTSDVEPLFAAPFHPVIPYEWDRYVP
jgi:hypothetical protein